MPEPVLTVVIPAYNEALRIGKSLCRIREFLERRGEPSEVIVVDDGSADGTPELLRQLSASWTCLRVIRNQSNRGKGYSVRRGVLEARGELVVFTDADLSAPIEETDKLIEALKRNRADAAVASRAVDRRLIGVHQPAFREWGGRLFNLIVRLFTGLKISDTQCGLKLFRRSTTRRAFESQRSTGFGFDPEVLYLIERRGGRVVEIPVRWNHDPATKVRFLRDSLRMVLDLAAIRWRALTGRYRI